MCGRFTVSVTNEELELYVREHYQIEEFNYNLTLPLYNIAPSQKIISIINDGDKNRIGLLKWGFVPHFAKAEKPIYINAKSETLHEKPAFIESFRNKRCIILADSFYEWGNKIPYRIILKNNNIFPMAGLWNSFNRLDGTKIYTCTIITTQANATVSPIHKRMPVILTNKSKDIWLDPSITNLEYLSSLLVPYDDNEMDSYKVSTLINTISNNSSECINSI